MDCTSQPGPGVYVNAICLVEALESQGRSQEDLGCLLFLLRLILLNIIKAAYPSSRVTLLWYKAHCRRTFFMLCFHDESWNTSENVRNSVKYLYLIAGRAIDAMRTWYKRTTDVLSTGRMWNKRSVALYNVVWTYFCLCRIVTRPWWIRTCNWRSMDAARMQ